MWQVPRYNEGTSSSRRTHLKAPTLLDLGGISGDLINFSSTNGALLAVKGTEEDNDSYFVGLTRHCGYSPITKNKFLHCVELTWKHPLRWIEAAFQVT
jgi:hypothetical protein